MKQIYTIIIGIGIVALLVYGGYMLLRSNEPIIPDTTSTSTPAEIPMVQQAGLDEPYVDLYPDDADRDGITNEEEELLGLDPQEYDTDLDGLADAFELNTTKTDPLDRDTDEDGLSDGEEFLIWKTNPLLADSDSDGFDDITEIDNGYNPNGDGPLSS